MRLRIAYLLAWAVATTVVAGASSLGIRSILNAPSMARAGAENHSDLGLAPAPGPGSAILATPDASGNASPSWSTVPDGKGGTAYRRTFRTAGGDAVLWAEPGAARVLSTTPNTGYTVSVRRVADDAVEVSFTHNRQISRVLVRWWDNAPYAELTESVV